MEHDMLGSVPEKHMMSQAVRQLGRRMAYVLILTPLRIYGVSTAFASLPVTFEENDGQVAPEVAFLSRTTGYRLFLTRQGAVIRSQDGTTVRIRLALSNNPAPVGTHRLLAKSNYLLGPVPARWRRGIANYEGVTYSQVYPGIDLTWHAHGDEIEHDFLVAPSADPQRIRLVFSGAALRLTPEGDLMAGTFRFHKLRAYQDGREVVCRYERRGQSVRFVLGPYDHSRPLMIDPVLSLSTFLGGSGNDSAAAIALDRAGNIYVAGSTESADFPSTPGVFQPNATGDQCPNLFSGTHPCRDIFVTKMRSDGGTLLYSTYLGGRGDDFASGVAVDAAGNVYLSGTAGPNFPKLTPMAGQTGPTYGSFVARLSADGSSLAYATTVPTYVYATAIAPDTSGALYITGSTYGGWLPLRNAFQGGSGYAQLFKTADGGKHWQGFASGLPIDDLPRTITVDPTNPQVLYEGFFQGALFKSTDAGLHWSSIRDRLEAGTALTSLAIDPHSPETLYLATLNGTLHSTAIYKSTDGGANWIGSATGIESGNVMRDLALDPNSPATLYAGTDAGLFKSTDAAASWNPTSLSTRPWRIVLDPSQSGVIYVATGNGVMKSTDAGTTWTALTNGFTQSVDVLALAIDPVDPQTLYAATTVNFGVYATHDGGAHWTKTPWPFGLTYVESLRVDPAQHSRVWAGTENGVLVSVDSGATWSVTPSPFPHLAIPALAADGQGAIYAVGSGWTLPDAFAMKLDAGGSQIVYSTYLGGLGYDVGSGIAVDGAGRAYITGRTDSPDFPLAAAVQPRIGGDYDAFVTVLDPSGALVWSTYFGGSGGEQPAGLALDAAGNVHLGGVVYPGPYAINLDTYAFAGKLKGDGTAILYSTPATAAGSTTVSGVAADAAGNTYLAGTTSSPNLPTVNAVQPALAGTKNAFVAALNGKTGAVQYATYLGGSGTDSANGIAADAAGDVYLAGDTSSPDFPQKYSRQTYGPCTPYPSGCAPGHAFVAELGAADNEPALRVNAVTDAARYGQVLAPGELVTIWGTDIAVTPASSAQPPLPTHLSDVKVTVNGLPAPLIYVSASQVNAQIPFETPAGPAQVQVISGAGTATQTVQIAAVAPALFTLNASGAGAGAIQHANTYQVVTEANPARAGEIIAIYCTGLGAVSPAVQTGTTPPDPPPQVVAPVRVSIAGVMAPITYQGVAPGFPGLYQVNAQIPAGTPSGAQPLQITQNNVMSNIVTVAVQ
jgi:uncharacterized protein (TIGR03437 family)